MTSPVPTEIRVTEKGQRLILAYEDGSTIALAAEFLRVESPSAEVQGHTPKDKRLIAGKKDVAITGIDPVGTYAVKITFSDGHSTGIFAWETFQTLHTRQDELWSAYLKNLAERGLSR
ncbi:MAG: DUF971 domain-containing protein [Proteobacteria bacterium]|nr:DUF971 domain-containing protein [Pseudomonadota bacterium]